MTRPVLSGCIDKDGFKVMQTGGCSASTESASSDQVSEFRGATTWRSLPRQVMVFFRELSKVQVRINQILSRQDHRGLWFQRGRAQGLQICKEGQKRRPPGVPCAQLIYPYIGCCAPREHLSWVQIGNICRVESTFGPSTERRVTQTQSYTSRACCFVTGWTFVVDCAAWWQFSFVREVYRRRVRSDVFTVSSCIRERQLTILCLLIWLGGGVGRRLGTSWNLKSARARRNNRTRWVGPISYLVYLNEHFHPGTILSEA